LIQIIDVYSQVEQTLKKDAYRETLLLNYYYKP
jgi:hypothetical protein